MGKRFFSPCNTRMSDADTNDRTEREKSTINIRLTESFLEDIDEAWHGEMYNNRSEFIRDALRDVVKHPDLTRETWKEIAAVEHARRTGESETFPRNASVLG